MTVFLGCGFAAKYREGGGNFSVPLQWMLGLRRLKQDAIWLELLPATGDRVADARCIANFQRQLRAHGLARRYCLLYQDPANQEQDLAAMRCIGISRRELRERLAGPNVLLNLAYSIHPPLLLEFERRIFCDLDPSEIFYWMTKLDLGQRHHHEFWTIGLNVQGATIADCQSRPLRLADILSARRYGVAARPAPATAAEVYHHRPMVLGRPSVEVNGEFPDLSKKHAFEPYLDLPSRVPEADMGTGDEYQRG